MSVSTTLPYSLLETSPVNGECDCNSGVGPAAWVSGRRARSGEAARIASHAPTVEIATDTTRGRGCGFVQGTEQGTEGAVMPSP